MCLTITVKHTRKEDTDIELQVSTLGGLVLLVKVKVPLLTQVDAESVPQ